MQECINCHEKYNNDEIIYFCKNCANILEIKLDTQNEAEIVHNLSPAKTQKNMIQLSVWRYRDFMPINKTTKPVTLGEGGTGLHRCENLSKILGIDELWVKNEGENPTGSFKDRGMTLGVTKAVELGAKHVICASTGNTSASLAAYAARAGIQCSVLIPSGKIAYGKLSQAMIYGAKVLQIKGNFDKALELVFQITEKNKNIYMLNSINPFRIEGQKTLAFEICEQLAAQSVKPQESDYLVPDRLVVPVGNAGNISAIWKGFCEFNELGLINKLPKMTGIQAVGSAPIARAVKNKCGEIEPVTEPETLATAIRIGAPVSWKKALNAINLSGGTAETVTDEEILEAQKLLASVEGIFVEPASASSIAGLKKLLSSGIINKNEKIVCVVTGNGLKDPDTAINMCKKPVEVDADISEIEKALC